MIMTKSDFLRKIFIVGDAVPSISKSLCEKGFCLPHLYQDMMKSIVKKDKQDEYLETYWKEKAKEYVALAGSRYSISNGDYPEDAIYKSKFIDELRASSNADQTTPPDYRVAQIGLDSLENMDEDSRKIVNDFSTTALARRYFERSNLGCANNIGFDELSFGEKREVIFHLFLEVFTSRNFMAVERKNSSKSPSVKFDFEGVDWEMRCALSYDYKSKIYPPAVSLFLIKKNQKIDLWSAKVNKEHLIEIKAVDLCPGIYYYPWRCESYMDFAVAFEAYHALYSEIKGNLSRLL